MQGHHQKFIESQLPVDELLKRAEQGDADCLYWAGIRYFQGDGVPEDPHKAIDLCLQAAQKSDARACAFLGYCSSYGIVVKKDQKVAVRMYRFAAGAGYPPAQHTLGCFFLSGDGVRKNIRLALSWLNKAADQGLPEALVKLGDLYHEGREVVEDEEKACGYYRRAAELGSARGQYMYGSFLMKGITTKSDPLAALDLLDQAVAQGYEPAREIQEYYEQFVRFDPAEAGFKDFPVGHPFPVRRRTAVYVEALGRPCLQAMASDICDYIHDNPKDEEAG